MSRVNAAQVHFVYTRMRIYFGKAGRILHDPLLLLIYYFLPEGTIPF